MPKANLPTPDAERRQLTVMFTDLVSSTQLSGRFDPEDYRDILLAYQSTCSEVVNRFDGYIAQHLGDALLVYFGYPQAHEDDVQRAVRTGLSLLDAMNGLNDRLEQTWGIRLHTRVGIHTGLVVVSNVGGGGHQEQLALGETPNLASRIQDLAAPDTVAISDVSYRFVEGYFDCHDLGLHALKGVAEPKRVYRVNGESTARSRLDVARAHRLTPFVGRRHEIKLLLEHWEQVKGGQGQVVFLSGEGGIGKSRLVQVLKDHVAEEAHLCLEFRSSPYHQNTALYPFIDFFQQALHWQADDTPDEKLEKLERTLKPYRLPINETVPLFATLLSLPLPEDRYPPLNWTLQRHRQKTLEGIVANLLERAEQRPVLLILEDLHWLDPTSVELLDLLIDQTPTASVYILLTYRPEFQPLWRERADFTRVTLNRLPCPQVEQLIEGLIGGKTLPAEVLQQIIEKADGIPLFVEEITKAVLESGVLKATNQHYELVGSLNTLMIPETLQGSLMARLDRLGLGKEVAQLAAAIGRQFSYHLLRSVAPWHDTALHQGLRQIIDAELCQQHGAIPHSIYMFKHALIRDAAYDSMLRSRRREIHGRIARVLEADPRVLKDREAETIARHFEAAQEIRRAIDYWEKAGQQARGHSANQEAAAHFAHAIHLLRSHVAQRERAEHELRLRIELGGQLIACHGNGASEVEENYEHARALLDRVHDRQLAFRAQHGLRTFYMVHGPLQRARDLGEQLLQLAKELGDDSLLLQAYRPHGLCLFAIGEFTSARQYLEGAIALYRPDAHGSQRFEYISDPLVLARCNLGWTMCFLHDRTQALDQAHRAIELAEQLDHQHSLAFALSLAASTHQVLRELDSTQALAERTLGLSQTYGYPYWAAWARMLLGWVRGQSGLLTHAAQEIQAGLHAYQETGARMMLPYFLVLLAETEMQRREPESALAHLEAAKEMIDITGTRFYEAELYRIMGCLLAGYLQEQSEAHHAFLQAIHIAANQGNVLLQHYARQSLNEFLSSKHRSRRRPKHTP
jgi:class 3 adenylate cyclase/predicted ATPase